MGNNNIIKHIDLSKLPRKKDGKINWVKSAGYSVPFIYGDINGEIDLIEYNVDKRSFTIFIDGYTKYQYDNASIDTIKQCALGALLHKKIIDTNPELIQYFIDKTDPLKYSVQSNKRVDMICPFCNYTKTSLISNLYKFGFGCPQCSDGISYPNKFMFNVLKQLHIDFKNEVTKRTPGFEWVGCYRYDFYFEHEDCKYFIEMDGHFHKNIILGSYKKNVESDMTKNKLASEHNIHIIRIDCCYNKTYGRFEYIKSKIIGSLLSDIFDLNCIDWYAANKSALSSNIYIAAQLWNDEYTIKQIAEILYVSRDSIRSYLKIAKEINLCRYDKDISEQRRIKSINLAKKSSAKLIDL